MFYRHCTFTEDFPNFNPLNCAQSKLQIKHLSKPTIKQAYRFEIRAPYKVSGSYRLLYGYVGSQYEMGTTSIPL